MGATTAAESSARVLLQELTQRHPLPPGWSLSEIFLQEITVAQLRLCMVGLVASRDAAQSLGSAADSDSYPIERAYYELLERISIQHAQRAEQLWVRDVHANAIAQRAGRRVFPPDPFPERLRLALSNGVALHAGWQNACAAARRELVERDRVLRSFAGEITPRCLHQTPSALALALAPEYRYAAYALDTASDCQEHVVSVFLWPSARTNPLVYGFGAAEDTAGAQARAEGEAVQRLAFLWGEALPAQAPEPAPTPDYHQEYYLYPPHHAQLVAWLEGRRPPPTRKRGAPLDADELTFIDLTPAAVSSSGLYVAKAVSPHARKLRFGATRGGPHPIV